MERPNRLGDRGITRFLVNHLEHELDEFVDTRPLADRTRDVIARALSEGMPKMGDVARRLGARTRSLHRQLADERLTFRTPTEDTRREIAGGLLKEKPYSIAETAYLTGISEQSAFNRAFKRWTGRTPSRHRGDRASS